MPTNERFVPQKAESNVKPTVPYTEARKGNEKTWYDKLGTSFADLGRDIVTANEMAKDKFDGDSALMHAARGGMTTLVGIGLDAALENVLSKGIRQGELWVSKQKFELGKEMGEQLMALGRKHPRARYFIESATKNFMTGLTYNTIAYFSSRALPTAEPKHFLGSLVASAAESMGPKGLEKIGGAPIETTDRDRMQAARLLEVEASERKAAYTDSPLPDVVAEESRQKWLDELAKKQQTFKTGRAEYKVESAKLKAEGKKPKPINEVWPKPATRSELRSEKERIAADAIAAGEAAKVRRHNLLANAFKTKIASDKLNNSLKYAEKKNAEPAHSNWKNEAQKLIRYANPATLLGIDWMTAGVSEIVKNTKAVRKVRKEKGIVGKSVEMQKKDEWRKPWEQRGKYENKGKWQGNKDKVYYGTSDWNASVKAPVEEIPYEKFD